MFDRKSLTMTKFVQSNKQLFEDVAKQYTHNQKNDVYTILDYRRIISEMTEYINGYLKYKNGDDKRYSGKILGTTLSFYNAMFTTDNYRREIALSDFRDVVEQYLQKTKELQSLMEAQFKSIDEEPNNELKQLLIMTNNQYEKVSKVHKDDMKIYLWLTSSNYTNKYFDV